ncbi:MAG: HDIG domain-containing protein [Sedimentisphaerales bacterium]|nr:HDIG domain-containing protein [Sedimentisphaerales bacterium]
MKKKVSARRQQVRNTIAAERLGRFSLFINGPNPSAIGVLLLFMAGVIYLLGLDTQDKTVTVLFSRFKPPVELAALAVIVVLTCLGAAVYIKHYQPRIIGRKSRCLNLAILLWLLLALTRVGSMYPGWEYLATGTVIAAAMIMTIVYNQRFALGISLFYSILVCFAVDRIETVELFLTMMSGAAVCCFSLREIRTRMKLVQVSAAAALLVFIIAAAMQTIQSVPPEGFLKPALSASVITIAVGIIIQAFLPIIERVFKIATSMTLMEYSDANQPLLKKLAMEAPGTFSHCLLIGSMAENAAEAIGANGLLCRVGSYYHDIGKINKPGYFVENQMGSVSRHDQLSPAMSQLVIVGHVKDGIEIAREYGLPSVLRQFIESHHGTTLMEFFYNEAKKRQDEKMSPVSEAEFRYPGPKPRTKESAIVMLADAAESAGRSMTEATPNKIETLVHSIAMKRLQDGQFDECDLTLKELSRIEAALAKSLAAHHHGRIAYPKLNSSEDSQTRSAAVASVQQAQ